MTDLPSSDPTPVVERDYLLSPKLYDVLKLIALVLLPAAGAFYSALALIWGLPSADKVLLTITAVNAFLGVLIKIGDASYNASESKFDGRFQVQPNPDGRGAVVTPQFTQQLPQLLKQGEVKLKIEEVPPAPPVPPAA